LFTFWHFGILRAKRRSDKRRAVSGTEVRDWELPTNAIPGIRDHSPIPNRSRRFGAIGWGNFVAPPPL